MQKQFLTVDECCELTGYKKNSIYAYVTRKQIPYFKLRGEKLLRFERDKIIDWMTSGTADGPEAQ